MTSTQSLEILGLKPLASKKQIKQAYRKQAMRFHPDRNPSQEAKTRFLNIQKAYEFLEDNNFDTKVEYRRPQSQNKSYTRPFETERERRRRRAKAYRKRRDEAYKKSPQYKRDLAMGILIDQIGNVMICLTALAAVLFLFAGPPGIFMSIFLIVVITKPAQNNFKKKIKWFDLSAFKMAFKVVYNYYKLLIPMLLALHFICLYSFGLDTFIQNQFFHIYAWSFLLSYILVRIKLLNRRISESFGLVTLAINFILIINFYTAQQTEIKRTNTYFYDSRSKGLLFADVDDETSFYGYKNVLFFGKFHRDFYRQTIEFELGKGIFGFDVVLDRKNL